MVLVKDVLNNHLWGAADILRGSIDSSEYKQYIFGMLFLKRLSDQFEENAKKIEKELIDSGVSEKEAHEISLTDPTEHDTGFIVPNRARWGSLQKVGVDIGEAINKAFESLEAENSQLEGVLISIDFNDKERLTDAVLGKLILHFSKHNLADSNLESGDTLGGAYEYLIEHFADDGGKKGGEFYTPTCVVDLTTRILNPTEGMKVCDPNCGSGGFLISAINNIKRQKGDLRNIRLYGQEMNLNTWAICKMNMLLHGILDARIEKGDTMASPKLVEGGELMVFDRVLANPMWNQKQWSREWLEKGDPYNRVIYGLPPRSSADWMWIQHMMKTLNESGMLGIVLDNGVLFRGGQEKACREGYIKSDLIEAVIALPGNLFANTSSPGTILIFNKSKEKKRKGQILFIDASNDFISGKNQNKLGEENILKVLNAYQKFKTIDKFSSIIKLKDIVENNFNLNVSLYVDTSEPEVKINVSKVSQELKGLIKKRDKTHEEVLSYLRELGYEK